MQLPKNYYHCFMGNGTDAVLIGYTGSMVADKVSVDRCNWYKSNRYYPEDKLVMVAAEACIEHYKETLIEHENTKSGFPGQWVFWALSSRGSTRVIWPGKSFRMRVQRFAISVA